jgi:hypothetical protein
MKGRRGKDRAESRGREMGKRRKKRRKGRMVRCQIELYTTHLDGYVVCLQVKWFIQRGGV